MFDIGWQEIFIIAVLAIIVVGPKELPQTLRTVTKWIRKGRALAREFQNGLNEMVEESGLDEVKKNIESATEFDIEHEIGKTIDPGGEIAKETDMTKVEKELDESAMVPVEGESADAGEGPSPDEGPPANSDSAGEAEPRSKASG